MAFVTGLAGEKFDYSFRGMVFASILGTAACYIMGLAWFMFLTGTGLWASMIMCMFPFLPGDLLKVLLASFLVSRYRKQIIEQY